MVRIAHLADTHLGYKQYNLDEREKDIYDSLEEIGDKILEEHADIVIHSGDLFDSPRPTPQAYRAFKKFLTKLDGKAKIFAVLGDHDRPKSRGLAPHVLFEDQMQILGVSGNAEHQSCEGDGQDVLIAGLSNLSRTYHVVLVEELKKLGALRLDGKLSVLVLHEGIDKFLPFEGAFELGLDEVPKNFDYLRWGIFIRGLRLRSATVSWLILVLPRLLEKMRLAVGRSLEKASSSWILKATTLR